MLNDLRKGLFLAILATLNVLLFLNGQYIFGFLILNKTIVTLFSIVFKRDPQYEAWAIERNKKLPRWRAAVRTFFDLGEAESKKVVMIQRLVNLGTSIAAILAAVAYFAPPTVFWGAVVVAVVLTFIGLRRYFRTEKPAQSI